MTREEIRRIQRQNKRYWKRREMRQRAHLYDKTVTDLDRELGRQYARVGRDLKRLFLSTIEELKNQDGVITPSDLYKSGRYYKLMNQVNEELSNLALKQTKAIESKLVDVYEEQSLIEKNVLGDRFGLYSTVDTEAAKRVVNELWCNDGKGLSDRIWHNKDLTVNRLEESLFDFVSRGQPTAQLTSDLIADQIGQTAAEFGSVLDDDFREAYNNARRLVRTETARIQNRSTQDRYKEAGFTKYRIIAEPDCCEVCDDLQTQVFDIDDLVLPAHPNCRCAMAAITESLQ